MKFPFLTASGAENGWYRVGPLARRAELRLHPDARWPRPSARSSSPTAGGEPMHATLAYHWARMIEMLHAAEVIKDLLHDPDILGDDLVATGERRREGVGVIEAPRGTLIHHYRVDDDDLVTMCNLIVSTTHNNQAMNEAVRQVARAVPATATSSPKACSTTSRWRSAPTTPACPAPPMRWARCRSRSSWSTPTARCVDRAAPRRRRRDSRRDGA